MNKPYYYAYDNRFCRVHQQGIRWFGDSPTPLVGQTIRDLGLMPTARILELGCGEGRDAGALLQAGYAVDARDVSVEAIRYCRYTYPAFAHRFAVADCVADAPRGQYDFVYAVSVLHMLVHPDHRAAFCRYVADSMAADGYALVCSMGDGQTQRCTDPSQAFDLQPRRWGQQTLLLEATTCRMVTTDEFLAELDGAGLDVQKHGVVDCDQYGCLMYVLARRRH